MLTLFTSAGRYHEIAVRIRLLVNGGVFRWLFIQQVDLNLAQHVAIQTVVAEVENQRHREKQYRQDNHNKLPSPAGFA